MMDCKNVNNQMMQGAGPPEERKGRGQKTKWRGLRKKFQAKRQMKEESSKGLR